VGGHGPPDAHVEIEIEIEMERENVAAVSAGAKM
jgi:hypothetical protein